MRPRAVPVVRLLVVASVMIAGCSRAPSAAPPATTAPAAAKPASSPAPAASGAAGLTVAMVLPGPINDKGFNQTGYDGLQQCQQAGAKISYSESAPVPQYVKTYENFAQNNQVIIGHGFEFGDIAGQVAPDYPNVKFIVTSNPLKPEHRNVLHLMANSTQGAYLVGALAGLTTKTNQLGGIAGFDFPVLKAQMQAFEAGAKAVNPAISFNVVYLGTFDDVAKGKEAATSAAGAGVDVIYHIADAAGLGVINGAKGSGIKAIGWGADQHDVAPETVIASELIDQAKEIGQACSDLAKGQFPGGTVRVDGLRSGVVAVSPLYNVAADVQAKLDAVKQQILDGSAVVPSIGGDIPGSGPQSG